MGDIYTFLREVFAHLFSDFKESDSLARVILLPIFFSGFGAFAGGLIAFRFRRKEEDYRRRKEKLDRSAKVVGLASGLCGSALSMKRQLVRPVAERYLESRSKVVRELGIPTVHKNIHLDLNLLTFTPPAMSAKEMLDAVISLSYGDPRNLSQAIAAFESYNNLETLCIGRNQWIAEFQSKSSETSNDRKMQMFYAIDDGNGTRDERYLHFIEGLMIAIDSVIFHSFEIYSRVALRLVDGTDLFKRQYKEKYGFGMTDFSEQVATGLFPDKDQFSDWLTKPNIYKKGFWESRTVFLERKKAAIRSGYS